MTLSPTRVLGRWIAGVTLIELVVVMVLVGIVGALVSQFVYPVFAYIDSTRRAALVDVADTALRRMGRDLRLALPNSVRVTTVSGVTYLEFLLVRTGGRYRAATAGGTDTTACPAGASGSADNNVLNFGTPQTCFKSIGGVQNLGQIALNSDRVVVFNLQPGSANSDAYLQTGAVNNNSQITAAVAGSGASLGEDRIAFTSNTFTYASPGSRFFVVQYPVTYACNVAAGTLTRYWNYAVPPGGAQSTPPGGSVALVASGVTGCTLKYDNTTLTQGAGLVTLSLQLSMQNTSGANESVNLTYEVHVNNVP
jgi:MSHA biogenesis protein MshO